MFTRVSLLLLLSAASLIGQTRAERLEVMRKDLETLADRRITATSGLSIREHTFQARYLLALGRPAAEAQRKIDDALSLQLADGDFPSEDRNTVEFTLFSIGPIWLRHGDKLSGTFKASAAPKIKSAIEAIRRHVVRLDYTNIQLMKVCNLMLLGEAMGDAKAAEEGYKGLQVWLDFVLVQRAGISEYVSPTYTGVQIMVLETAFTHTRNAAAKEKLKRALDLIWAHITANFFAGRSSLSGPHSRNYDVLIGDGRSTALCFYLEGLRKAFPTADEMPVMGDRGSLEVNALEGGYIPPDSILAVASAPEKVILQRYGPGTGRERFNHPGQDRYNYVTLDFAIGSVGSVCGTRQDRLTAVEFASSKELPAVTVLPGAEMPYGTGGTGFQAHSEILFTAVQEKGVQLILQDGRVIAYPGAIQGSAATTSIVFPTLVEVLTVDGAVLARPLADRALTAGDVLGLREGDGALAIRIFRGGRMTLKGDGSAVGAGRILVEGGGRTGILMMAARCAGEAEFKALLARAGEAAVTESETVPDGGNWDVTVSSGPLMLEASIGTALNHRRVDGKDFAPAGIFTVNGADWGSSLLSGPGVSIFSRGRMAASGKYGLEGPHRGPLRESYRLGFFASARWGHRLLDLKGRTLATQ